jgi:hypothetical protein
MKDFSHIRRRQRRMVAVFRLRSARQYVAVRMAGAAAERLGADGNLLLSELIQLVQQLESDGR